MASIRIRNPVVLAPSVGNFVNGFTSWEEPRTTDRIQGMSLFLTDSTLLKPLDYYDEWFYKPYLPRFSSIDFSKSPLTAFGMARTHNNHSWYSDLFYSQSFQYQSTLANLDFIIDLFDKIILHYQEAIVSTEAKQIEYDKTYLIGNGTTIIFYPTYFYLYGTLDGWSDPGQTVTFIQAYNYLIYLAQQYKDYYVDKRSELIANPSTISSLFPPNLNFGGYKIFFSHYNPNRLGIDFTTRIYQSTLSPVGPKYVGAFNAAQWVSRNLNLTFPNGSFHTSIDFNFLPYKLYYDTVKDSNNIIVLFNHSNNNFISNNFVFNRLQTFTNYLTRNITGYTYRVAASDFIIFDGIEKTPDVIGHVEDKYNRIELKPYEFYPDLGGSFDTTKIFSGMKPSKTRRKYFFFGEPSHTGQLIQSLVRTPVFEQPVLIFERNIKQQYSGETGYQQLPYTPQTLSRQSKVLRHADRYTESEQYQPLVPSSRWLIKPNFNEEKFSFIQPGPEDLTNVGSNTPSFPRKFIWLEDPENPITYYIRSRTHVYESPVGASFLSFTPTSDTTITPYTNWFGGSTEPASLLRVLITYDNGINDPEYFYVRLQSTKELPYIQRGPISTTNPPPEDYFDLSLGASNFISGVLTQGAFINSGKSILYTREITILNNVINVKHSIILDISGGPFTYHIFTTQHHFSEPL